MYKRMAVTFLFALVLLLVPSVALADNVAPTDTTWGSDGGTTTMDVASDVELANRVEVKGTVTLNLGENYSLNATKGITVNDGNTLIIEGTGKLIATGGVGGPNDRRGLSGIGGSYENPTGAITINGGDIAATGGSGDTDFNDDSGGAGIGGSASGDSVRDAWGGTITITGGTVTATGGSGDGYGGAGIGGGNGGGCDVTITGGTVSATGGANAADIGGGNASPHQTDSITINIQGGTVNATGAGIGSGYSAPPTGALSITLGWTKATDSITAKSCNATAIAADKIHLSDDKPFSRTGDTTHKRIEPSDLVGLEQPISIVPSALVTFIADGGTPAPDVQAVPFGGQASEPTDITKEGYRIDGWYNGDAKYDFSAAVTDSIELKARWTKVHTVTFKSNGGSDVVTQTVEDGKQATEPDDPTRSKYRFDGWFSDDKLTEAYDFSKSVTGDLTLYAKWTQLATLTFDLAGGTLDGQTGKVTVDAAIGDTIKLPAAPTRAGYNFKFWKGSEYAAGASYKVEGDHEFTAEWERAAYTITFDANGGSGEMDPQIVKTGSEAALAANKFMRDGYTFSGWNTQRDGKGTSYKDEGTVNPADDMTLYAQWEKEGGESGDYPIPVVSNSRGGTFTSTSQEITYTVSQAVPDYATSLRTWVDLEDVLYLTSDDVVVWTDGGKVLDSDVARVSIDGQRITVTVDDATSLRGKTLYYSYNAKLYSDADLSPYMNSEGNMASVPYQAHTVFDGNEGDVKHSKTEYVNFRVSKSSSGTSTKATSSKGTTLAKTGDPTSIVFAAITAIGGAGFVLAGRKRR